MLVGAAVSWGGNRVGNDSLRSCEIAYMGLTIAAREAGFLSMLKGEMDGVLEDEDKKVVLVYTNSQSAISLAEILVYHGRSTHILSEWHFIRERVAMGQIALGNVRTEKMGADMLTKVFGPNVIKVNMKLMGMSSG